MSYIMGGQVFAQALTIYPTLQGACFDADYRETSVNYVKTF